MSKIALAHGCGSEIGTDFGSPGKWNQRLKPAVPGHAEAQTDVKCFDSIADIAALGRLAELACAQFPPHRAFLEKLIGSTKNNILCQGAIPSTSCFSCCLGAFLAHDTN